MINDITPQNWQKIDVLNKERLQIEERIHLRSKLHHGAVLTQDMTDKLKGHSALIDAERYIEIEDLQWQLAGATKSQPDNAESFPT